MVYRLVYISKANRHLDDRELDHILSVSRINNSRKEIGGLLLFHEGKFFQVLEGEESRVERLYDDIAQDPRHYTIKRLQAGQVDKPLFGDWSMAYVPISSEEKRKLLGEGDFFTSFSPSNISDEQTRSLTEFIENMARSMLRPR